VPPLPPLFAPLPPSLPLPKKKKKKKKKKIIFSLMVQLEELKFGG